MHLFDREQEIRKNLAWEQWRGSKDRIMENRINEDYFRKLIASGSTFTIISVIKDNPDGTGRLRVKLATPDRKYLSLEVPLELEKNLSAIKEWLCKNYGVSQDTVTISESLKIAWRTEFIGRREV
ncbi:hypothetical protein DRN39_04580 [Thermococci archaeon]|nr:MAG: hypothetical protein DRN39_04580 [Thermococci archaeon]